MNEEKKKEIRDKIYNKLTDNSNNNALFDRKEGFLCLSHVHLSYIMNYIDEVLKEIK